MIKNFIEKNMLVLFILILPLFTTWACGLIDSSLINFETLYTSMLIYACMFIGYIMIKD